MGRISVGPTNPVDGGWKRICLVAKFSVLSSWWEMATSGWPYRFLRKFLAEYFWKSNSLPSFSFFSIPNQMKLWVTVKHNNWFTCTILSYHTDGFENFPYCEIKNWAKCARKGICNVKKFSLPFWVVKKKGVSCVRITDYGLVINMLKNQYLKWR